MRCATVKGITIMLEVLPVALNHLVALVALKTPRIGDWGLRHQVDGQHATDTVMAL